jgi:hypothetical protein
MAMVRAVLAGGGSIACAARHAADDGVGATSSADTTGDDVGASTLGSGTGAGATGDGEASGSSGATADCDPFADEIESMFSLDAPDDVPSGSEGNTVLEIVADDCVAESVGRASIALACTYDRAPTERGYALSFDLVPPPAAMPIVPGDAVALRAVLTSAFEVGTAGWLRLKRGGEPVVVAEHLDGWWDDAAVASLTADAFGVLANETGTIACSAAVPGTSASLYAESMLLHTPVVSLEVAHDRTMALGGPAGHFVWIGAATYREDVGDSARHRRRDAVLLAGP